MTQKNAAAQFAALGIPETDWTDAMRLAVKQKWSSLPVDAKVADLRARLASVETPAVPTIEALRLEFRAAGRAADLAAEDAIAEHKRLKRNAAVTAWRARNQIQAALDAREAKFAALRAKRGATVTPRPGTATGDSALAAAS